MIQNVGHHDQVEGARRVVYPVGEEDSTFHSERTASFGHVPGGHGDGMEACFGQVKPRDEDARPVSMVVGYWSSLYKGITVVVPMKFIRLVLFIVTRKHARTLQQEKIKTCIST